MSPVTPLAQQVAASSLSEVAWTGSGGEPRVRGVVTLVRSDAPVLAFTYADELVALDVAASPELVLALTEPRSTGSAFAPVVLRGRPRLVPDPSGEVFASELLVQELHRFPPSRALADSPLLQRENWWYLPRVLVEIDVTSVEPTVERAGPHDHLLAVAVRGGVDVRVARIAETSPGGLLLDVVGAPPVSGDAVLFGQDASFPDLERWSQWSYTGTWRSPELTVLRAPETTGLGPPLGLLSRWRRQRALERACRQAIPGP